MKAVFCIALLLLAAAVSAEMYKWVDERGVTQYSDTPPVDQPTVEIRGSISSYTTPSVEPLPADFFSHLKRPVRSNRVVIYSAEWCGVCKQAKAYFQKKNIQYAEYDIDKSKQAREQYDRLNAHGVPVILIGNQRLNGFNEKRFEQLYYRKQ